MDNFVFSGSCCIILWHFSYLLVKVIISCLHLNKRDGEKIKIYLYKFVRLFSFHFLQQTAREAQAKASEAFAVLLASPTAAHTQDGITSKWERDTN